MPKIISKQKARTWVKIKPHFSDITTSPFMGEAGATMAIPDLHSLTL